VIARRDEVADIDASEVDAAIEADADVAARGNYPQAWGVPPGSLHSEQRLEWVRANVRRHMQQQEHRRRISGVEARALLLRRRFGPGQGPKAR
jgi:hypothetical protein